MKGESNHWRQAGSVFAWRYTVDTRNFPGWHLAFDPLGLRSLEELFRRMAVAATGAFRSERVATPTSKVLGIANNGRAPVITAKHIRVVKVDPARAWSITASEIDLIISAGADQMLAFADWLRANRASFDTTFGQEPPLWYWGTVPPDKAPPNSRP